jgi:hypothetical protein
LNVSARQYLPLLLHALQKDSRRIQRSALRILFDMLHVYGLQKLFGARADQAPALCVDERGQPITAEFVLARLLAFLEDPRASLSAVAVEGLCVSICCVCLCVCLA